MEAAETVTTINAISVDHAAAKQGAEPQETSADGERRLWTAVLVQAIVEWRSNNVRASRAAERFLFEDDKDFDIVCASAGLNPQSFRSQLTRLGPKERLAFRRLAA